MQLVCPAHHAPNVILYGVVELHGRWDACAPDGLSIHGDAGGGVKSAELSVTVPSNVQP